MDVCHLRHSTSLVSAQEPGGDRKGYGTLVSHGRRGMHDDRQMLLAASKEVNMYVVKTMDAKGGGMVKLFEGFALVIMR